MINNNGNETGNSNPNKQYLYRSCVHHRGLPDCSGGTHQTDPNHGAGVFAEFCQIPYAGTYVIDWNDHRPCATKYDNFNAIPALNAFFFRVFCILVAQYLSILFIGWICTWITEMAGKALAYIFLICGSLGLISCFLIATCAGGMKSRKICAISLVTSAFFQGLVCGGCIETWMPTVLNSCLILCLVTNLCWLLIFCLQATWAFKLSTAALIIFLANLFEAGIVSLCWMDNWKLVLICAALSDMACFYILTCLWYFIWGKTLIETNKHPEPGDFVVAVAYVYCGFIEAYRFMLCRCCSHNYQEPY